MTSFINRFLHKKTTEEIKPDQKDLTPATYEPVMSVSKAQNEDKEINLPEQSHLDVPQFNVGVAQSVGIIRESNEDALFTLTTNLISNDNNLQFGLYMIADGMGGHENGEIASSIAINKLSGYVINSFYQPLFSSTNYKSDYSIQEILQMGLQQAHQTIKKETKGGGSTLTAALILGRQMTIAHVGDSRAYLLTPDGSLQLLTKDHSLVKRLEEIGQLSSDQASIDPQRNILYRALGQGELLEPDIATYQLQPGSQLMICTDGLWGVISEKDILNEIKSSSQPQNVCQSLVDMANSAGGPDNISIIVIRIPE